jgi:hypothetical protein
MLLVKRSKSVRQVARVTLALPDTCQVVQVGPAHACEALLLSAPSDGAECTIACKRSGSKLLQGRQPMLVDVYCLVLMPDMTPGAKVATTSRTPSRILSLEAPLQLQPLHQWWITDSFWRHNGGLVVTLQAAIAVCDWASATMPCHSGSRRPHVTPQPGCAFIDQCPPEAPGSGLRSGTQQDLCMRMLIVCVVGTASNNLFDLEVQPQAWTKLHVSCTAA